MLFDGEFVMKTVSRTITGAVAAVLLTTAVASPAEARHRRYDRDNGISLGDVVLGTIAVVGVATAIGAITNNGRYDRRNSSGRYGNDERTSVDACAYEAQREASRRYGGNARIRDIDDVDRSGRDGYRIRGTVEVDSRYSNNGYGNDGYGRDRYDRYERGSERVQFACTTRYGRVTGIRVGGGRDYAYGY